MRVLLLGNNRVAAEAAGLLRSFGEDIVGLVLHPAERAKYRSEIVEAAQVDPRRIFDGSLLNRTDFLGEIEELKADVAVSVFFGFILKPVFLKLFPKGVLNLHPSYLPYNRGSYPNVWSIIDGTPAGATLHYIDAGVDTGDIIAQRPVLVEPVDTGESLYGKLESACVDLFRDSWPLFSAGRTQRRSQEGTEGTVHRVRDVAGIDEIQLDRMYSGRQLIDLLRARTYPPYAGAYFRHGGRKVFVQVQLRYEDE